MSDFSRIPENLARVRERLEAAANTCGRSVVLLAVSKTFPAEAVDVALAAGQKAFGENYVQEGVEKIEWFKEKRPDSRIVWHFIGPLQSNKTRPVAEHFDWVESVDRLKIAQRLNDQRPDNLPPLNVLIEVNIDGEASKSGVVSDDLPALIESVRALPRLKLRGLMTIPAPADTREEKMKPLIAMRALFDGLKDRYGFDTLSMGMSADMTEAVEAGSTEVRVGSAIFGARHYPAKA